MQPESHPIELTNGKIAHQKLDYTHYKPVEAGFVKNSGYWKYSSAIDYHGGQGAIRYYTVGANNCMIKQWNRYAAAQSHAAYLRQKGNFYRSEDGLE